MFGSFPYYTFGSVVASPRPKFSEALIATEAGKFGNWNTATLNLPVVFSPRSLANNIQSTLIVTTLSHRRIAGKNTQYTDCIKLLNVIHFLMKISRRKFIFTVVFDT
jgi:hypothetical protein